MKTKMRRALLMTTVFALALVALPHVGTSAAGGPLLNSDSAAGRDFVVQ